jgi:hypothetical protein
MGLLQWLRNIGPRVTFSALSADAGWPSPFGNIEKRLNTIQTPETEAWHKTDLEMSSALI